jgi:hypothetical protein
MADPALVDLTIEPNKRQILGLMQPDPQVANWTIPGFVQMMTPEGWLSTWSGLSSNAAVARCLERVTVPTLVLEYTGDCSVFPSDIAAALSASGAADVTHEQIRADHFGRRLDPQDEEPIPATARVLIPWTEERAAR